MVLGTLLVGSLSLAANAVWGKEKMKLSSTGPLNTLPAFFFLAGGEEGGAFGTGTGAFSLFLSLCFLLSEEYTYQDDTSVLLPLCLSRIGFSGGRGTPSVLIPPDNCPDDLFENIMPDLRVPMIPWREQDDWGCERVPTDVDVIVLENEFIRATITPQWGGKIWSA